MRNFIRNSANLAIYFNDALFIACGFLLVPSVFYNYIFMLTLALIIIHQVGSFCILAKYKENSVISEESEEKLGIWELVEIKTHIIIDILNFRIYSLYDVIISFDDYSVDYLLEDEKFTTSSFESFLLITKAEINKYSLGECVLCYVKDGHIILK